MKLAALAVLAAGCAPVGFYQSAFPAENRFYFGMGGEAMRNYAGMEDDTSDTSAPPMVAGGARFPFSFSPIPILTFTPEIYNNGIAFGAKGTLFCNERVAGALIAVAFLGGGDETDPWDNTTIASTGLSGVEAGAVGSWRPSPSFTMSAGPKAIFGHEEYHNYESGRHYSGNALDLGGFTGLSIGTGRWSFDLDFSLLSVERPQMGKRELLPFGGFVAKVGWGRF